MFVEYFGFNEQPFGVTPDPRFLYMSPAHQEALASLVYGIETGRGFMALIAGPGLGKTTMLLRLMEQLETSARTALLFQTHLQSEAFLRSLVVDLGIEPPGASMGELQRQFSDALLHEWRAGKRVVVAIDEAQNLDNATLEMIRMLSNFETPQAKLLQIVLVGQRQLADRLSRPELEQLRQRISVITYFRPFQADEVEKYIEHRLSTAGYAGKKLFTPGALRLIGKHSEGIPRNINNLCFHALSLAFAKRQKQVTEVMLQEVIADLNLHRLRSEGGASVSAASAAGAAPAARPAASKPFHPGGTVEIPRATAPRAHPAAPVVDKPSSPLDDVEFLPDSPMDFKMGQRGRGIAAPAGRGMRSGTRRMSYGLIVVGVLLLVAIWGGPWLNDHFELVRHVEAMVEPVPVKSTVPDGVNAVDPASAAQKANLPGAPAAASTPSLRPDTTPIANPDVNTPAPTTLYDKSDMLRRDETAQSTGAAKPPVEKIGVRQPVKRDANLDDLGAAGSQGLLVVEASVNGAHISINGRSSLEWVTPHLFSLVRGAYNVKVIKAGYKPWTAQVNVDSPHEKWVTAALVNDRVNEHESGIFAVQTEPAGLQVLVDGRPYGASNVEGELSVGWHVCQVVPPSGGQPLSFRFHLNSGEIYTKRIQIASLASSPTGGVKGAPGFWSHARSN